MRRAAAHPPAPQLILSILFILSRKSTCPPLAVGPAEERVANKE